MVETMKNADGAGLAAPQVGVLKRVVVIDVEGVLYDLINRNENYMCDRV